MNQICKVLLLIISALCYFNYAPAQQFSGSERIMFSINEGWKFLPEGNAYAETVQFNDDKWQIVSLPHTWNAQDPFDDDRTYRRGISWYRKKLSLNKSFLNKRVFIYFEGANQVAHVYANGYFAGIHKGEYPGLEFDIYKTALPNS